jgi:cytochrome c
MNFKLIKSIAHALTLTSFVLSFSSLSHADEQTGNDASRGKLLYSLHCISCHNEQKHWLANKKVSDWPSLVSQVRLWQSISNLKWDNNDIESVAKHLNTVYYHYPLPNTVARKK